MGFNCSTQRRDWLFDEAQLKTMRHSAWEVAKELISKMSDAPPMCTPEEELVIVRHFEREIVNACGRFNPQLPKNVTATSIAYFQRFYLTNSISDYRPELMMYLCIFSACKTEEHVIPVVQLAKTSHDTKAVAEFVIEKELKLIQSLKFHLVIHHPFRPLKGFIIDMKAMGIYKEPNPNWDDITQRASNILMSWLTSDRALLYPPSQIALSALHKACGDKNVDFKPYLETLCKKDAKGRGTVEKITLILLSIQQGYDNTTSKNEVKTALLKSSKLNATLDTYRSKEQEEARQRSKRKRDADDGGQRETQRVKDADRDLLA